MKKQNKYLLLLLLFFCVNSVAQESLCPRISNPYLKSERQQIMKTKKVMAPVSLRLPFFDDFSYADSSTIPKQNLWADKNVYVNNTYGFEPISLGVATFDAIDSQGRLYTKALEKTSFFADVLTSNFINLNFYIKPADTVNNVPADTIKYTPEDNIYLSFFYEPGGMGEIPEKTDSLFLLFSRPDSLVESTVDSLRRSYWDTVWRAGGSGVNVFEQIFKKVDQTYWLKDKFQFRFVNKSSIYIKTNDPGRNTNGDLWNIDYVYLNKDRSNNDSAQVNDITIMGPATHSMLKNFESMPWSQFKLPNVYGLERADDIDIPIRNHRSELVYVETQTVFSDVYDNNLELDSSDFAEPVDAFQIYHVKSLVPKLSPDNDTAGKFNVKLNLVVDLLDNHPENNIYSYTQYFGNYFSYDDGTAEMGYGISGEGSNTAMFAMRFKTYRQETLTSVKMYFNESLQTKESAGISKNFYLTIWNDRGGFPGDTLYKKLNGTFNFNNEWHTIELDTPIIVPETFYVGWVQQSNYFANIGFDRNRSARKNTLYNLQGTADSWVNSSFDGAVMIRPVIKSGASASKTEVTDKTITVFPNPARNVLNIKLSDELVGSEFKLEINSITGLFNLVKKQSSSQIDIGNLQPGLYLIKITSSDGSVYTSKFLKTAQ